MLYGYLGDIAFQALTAPVSSQLTTGAAYAEHEVIDGKPVLQMTGTMLDILALSFYFHRDFTDPETAVKDLLQAEKTGAVLPLVYGDGTYPGDYVITDCIVTRTVTGGRGQMIACEVSVTLKEYNEAFVLEERKDKRLTGPRKKETASDAPIRKLSYDELVRKP